LVILRQNAAADVATAAQSQSTPTTTPTTTVKTGKKKKKKKKKKSRKVPRDVLRRTVFRKFREALEKTANDSCGGASFCFALAPFHYRCAGRQTCWA